MAGVVLNLPDNIGISEEIALAIAADCERAAQMRANLGIKVWLGEKLIWPTPTYWLGLVGLMPEILLKQATMLIDDHKKKHRRNATIVSWRLFEENEPYIELEISGATFEGRNFKKIMHYLPQAINANHSLPKGWFVQMDLSKNGFNWKPVFNVELEIAEITA